MRQFGKNFGLNLGKERWEVSEDDYVFGGTSQPCVATIPEEDREKYLPQGERQNIGDEKMDCASRAPLNILEAKFNWLLANNKIPQSHLNWLKEKGYIENGKVLFSDRFTAIKSETTREGNSLKAPLASINNDGLVPKSKFPQVEKWDDYYSGITKELENLGKGFLDRFQINYEKVYEQHYEELLKDDMLVVAGYAWPEPVNGIYPRVELDATHAFVDVKRPKHIIFDNYEESPNDFIKRLAEDYDLLGYGYRIRITILTEKESIVRQVWNTLWKNGLVVYFLSWFMDFNKEIKEPESNRIKLYNEAVKWLGKDASPRNQAPMEFACAESVNEIYKNVFGEYLSPKNPLSTYYLYRDLREKCDVVLEPKAGDIVISPTGFNSPTNPIKNGHCGIFYDDFKIMSNNSYTGKWEVNYNKDTWKERYATQGGYPMIFFRVG